MPINVFSVRGWSKLRFRGLVAAFIAFVTVAVETSPALAKPAATRVQSTPTPSISRSPTATPTLTPTASPTATPTPEAYAKVGALLRFGFFDEASKTLMEAMKNDPANLSASRWRDVTEGWWAWFEYVSALLIYGAKRLALGLGFLAIPVALVVLLRRKRTVNVANLANAVPGLALPQPSGLELAVEENLVRMGRSHTIRHLGVVDQAPDPLPLPAQVSFPTDVSSIINVLSYFIPKRSLELTGALRHDSETGAGISVRIVHKGTHRLWGSFTFCQKELCLEPTRANPQLADFLALTEVVAIWTYWTIYERSARDGKRDKELRRAFGTSNWHSYASVRLSAKATSSERKIRLLRESLRCDPDNRYALLNLGSARKNTATPEQLRECFDRVIKLAGSSQHDVARILANYELGVLGLNVYASGRRATDLESARAALKQAFDEMKRPPGTLRGEQDTISEEARNSLAIMYAHALQLEPAEVSPETLAFAADLISEIEAKPYLPPGVRWNLACHYSDLADVATATSANAQPYLANSLVHLKLALTAQPTWAEELATDPSLSAVRTLKPQDIDALLACLPAAGEFAELRVRVRKWLDQNPSGNLQALEAFLRGRTPRITTPGAIWIVSESVESVLQAAIAAFSIP